MDMRIAQIVVSALLLGAFYFAPVLVACKKESALYGAGLAAVLSLVLITALFMLFDSFILINADAWALLQAQCK